MFLRKRLLWYIDAKRRTIIINWNLEKNLIRNNCIFCEACSLLKTLQNGRERNSAKHQRAHFCRIPKLRSTWWTCRCPSPTQSHHVTMWSDTINSRESTSGNPVSHNQLCPSHNCFSLGHNWPSPVQLKLSQSWSYDCVFASFLCGHDHHHHHHQHTMIIFVIIIPVMLINMIIIIMFNILDLLLHPSWVTLVIIMIIITTLRPWLPW